MHLLLKKNQYKKPCGGTSTGRYPAEKMPAEESPVEESVVEDTPAEETLVEQTSAEPVPIDNIARGISNEGDVSMDTEEDGPLEDLTVKELKEECKSLGLTEKGKKQILLSVSKLIGLLLK